MSRTTRTTARTTQSRADDFGEFLKPIDMFFQEKGPVFQTLRRLVRRLEKAQIAYVVVGGLAVYAHEYRRTTDDVDVLLSAEGLTEFRRQFVPKNYTHVPGRSRRFVDKISKVQLDILVTGHFPGRGDPGPFAFPDPADVGEVIKKIRFINLVTLVQLKLAARRYQDFADVVALIRANELAEAFAERLDASVRGDYIECLEEKRREDEYEAREG
jgi:hypothetical protein